MPDVLRLLDGIYAAASDRQAWPEAVAAIADALAARATSLHVLAAAKRREGVHRDGALLVAPRTDPDWLRLFSERWARRNVLRERGLALPTGAIYRFHDLMHPGEFERSAFYNEFWVPQQNERALFANVANAREIVAGIGFYRPAREGPFGAEEESLLRLLLPHLRRAVMLNLRLASLDVQRDAVAEALTRNDIGLLLVDARSRILFANGAAESLLRDGAGLRVISGRLAAVLPAQTTALRGLIARTKEGVAGAELALGCGNGPALAVLVAPARSRIRDDAPAAAAIVLAKSPSADSGALPGADAIRHMFGLTRAQATLAREILHGDGIDAAARRLGIARSTARTHLLEIFQRTGTSRQAELVRVILQHAPTAHAVA